MSGNPHLGHEKAWLMASYALKMLTERGWGASVCLVNKSGRTLVDLHMDQSRGLSLAMAQRKAWQSAHTGWRTGFLDQMVQSGKRPLGALGIDPHSYCPAAGGVPIYDDAERLVGGLGVSNLSPRQDEEIAVCAVEQAGFFSEWPDIGKLKPIEG